MISVAIVFAAGFICASSNCRIESFVENRSNSDHSLSRLLNLTGTISKKRLHIDKQTNNILSTNGNMITFGDLLCTDNKTNKQTDPTR